MFLLPVHGVRELAPEIFELALERRGYRFVPGECAVLFDDGAESRPYSFASAPDEAVLRFLIRRMPGGIVSSWLAARRPGDGVRLSTPFGDFRPGQEGAPGAPAVFVATGVGIAPFLSWLGGRNPSPLPAPPRGEGSERKGASAGPPAPAPTPSPLEGEGGGEGVGKQPRPAPEPASFAKASEDESARCGASPVCLYGVRRARDALFLDLLRRQTDLRLAASREDAPGFRRGRVTDLLSEIPIAPDTQFYLCGLDAMVDQVAYWLDARGVEHSRVHTEVFFKA